MNQQDKHANPADDALRAALRQSFAAEPQPQAEQLQQRVMAEWRLHAAAQPAPLMQAAQAGPVAALRSGWHPHRRHLAAAALLLLGVLIASNALWSRPDPTLDELLQPDVLSLIAVGEL